MSPGGQGAGQLRIKEKSFDAPDATVLAGIAQDAVPLVLEDTGSRLMGRHHGTVGSPAREERPPWRVVAAGDGDDVGSLNQLLQGLSLDVAYQAHGMFE